MAKDTNPLSEFLGASLAASWPEALWHALLDYFGARGIPRVSYHHLPPLGAPDEGRIRVIAHGFPDDWTHSYIRKKKYRHDPIPAQAIAQELPFLWSEIRRLRRLSPEEEAFLSEMAEADMGEGIAVSAFGPGARQGYFGLGLGPRARVPDAATQSEFHWVCQSAHLRYCRMIRTQLPAPPSLSPREATILQWVAQGKSNGVIAEIMSLSPHTIDAHLRRIFLKLGTGDRISAAIRGLGLGVIRSY